MRHNLIGKMIHWELCKRLKFDRTNKWYMNKSESLLENETHKNLWDFEIKKDHLISARRLNLMLIDKKKKNGYLLDLVREIN